MPRTAAEIEAELAALKAKGVDMRSKEAKALRDERKALETPVVLEAESVGEAPALPAFIMPDFTPPAPTALDSPEWAFIEKACAEMEVPEGIHPVKKVYQALWGRLRIWRIARELVINLGPGAEWPSFTALGLNPDTGLKETPKPVAPPAPKAPLEAVTEGGMPIRSARPSAEAILAAVTGGDPRAGLKQDIASRPEPARSEPMPV